MLKKCLHMSPDFVLEQTSCWKKPLSTSVTVPSYGQYVDKEGADKTAYGAVSGNLFGQFIQPWWTWPHDASIKALQIFCIPARENLLRSSKHLLRSKLGSYTTNLSHYVFVQAWSSDAT